MHPYILHILVNAPPPETPILKINVTMVISPFHKLMAKRTNTLHSTSARSGLLFCQVVLIAMETNLLHAWQTCPCAHTFESEFLDVPDIITWMTLLFSTVRGCRITRIIFIPENLQFQNRKLVLLTLIYLFLHFTTHQISYRHDSKYRHILFER